MNINTPSSLLGTPYTAILYIMQTGHNILTRVNNEFALIKEQMLGGKTLKVLGIID